MSAAERITTKLLDILHEKLGICGHCGMRKCAGKKEYSRLPDSIPLDVLIAAIESVKK